MGKYVLFFKKEKKLLFKFCRDILLAKICLVGFFHNMVQKPKQTFGQLNIIAV